MKVTITIENDNGNRLSMHTTDLSVDSAYGCMLHSMYRMLREKMDVVEEGNALCQRADKEVPR